MRLTSFIDPKAIVPVLKTSAADVDARDPAAVTSLKGRVIREMVEGLAAAGGFPHGDLEDIIKAVLRRRAPETTDELVDIAGLALDPVTHRVSGHGAPIELGPTEFRLLHFLMTHPERVHSRAQRRRRSHRGRARPHTTH